MLEKIIDMVKSAFNETRNKYQVYDAFVCAWSKEFYKENTALFHNDPIAYWSQFRRHQEQEWTKYWYKIGGV
jgi:hypothetical protein